MNILSLFDGMSCGQIAINRLGVKYDNYFACEIGKYAIKITQHNYPGTIQLGDVTKIRAKDLPKIDLLLAGSPCQGFSFAGKGLAFDDPRSKLFFEFVRILNEVKEINPDAKYLLENVKMKQEHETVISRILNINPIEINSALVSAQNRVRLYWTNIESKPVGFFGDLECMIPQPKDKGVLLKDVLEKNADKKYHLSDKMLNYFNNRAANFNNGKINIRQEDQKSTTLISSMASCDISDNFIKVNTNLEVSANQDKSGCFTAGGNSGGLHSDMDLILEKSPCLHGFEHGTNGQLNRQLLEGGMIRRLTPIECERLQTVPDNYTSPVSDTRRYHALGNGWTVDVICHILSYLNK